MHLDGLRCKAGLGSLDFRHMSLALALAPGVAASSIGVVGGPSGAAWSGLLACYLLLVAFAATGQRSSRRDGPDRNPDPPGCRTVGFSPEARSLETRRCSRLGGRRGLDKCWHDSLSMLDRRGNLYLPTRPHGAPAGKS